MQGIVLFPYHPDAVTVVAFKDSLVEYELRGLVSYKDDRYLVADINQACGAQALSEEQLLSDCEAVVILDNYRGYSQAKYYEIIDAAISLNKDVLVTPQACLQLDLTAYAGKYRVLENLLNAPEENLSQEMISITKDLYEVDVPIIGVLGLGKHCGKFENLLTLKRVMEKDYSAISISSNSLGALFGCYTMPNFMFERISFLEKIIRFNAYMHSVSVSAEPDVVLLSVPEGIAPFESQEFHHFAEYPLVVSSAVSIDYAILCTYFVEAGGHEHIAHAFDAYAELCRGKFGIDADVFAISKTRFEMASGGVDRLTFEFLTESFLSKYYPDISRINRPVIDMTKPETAEEIIQKSLLRLRENAEPI